MKLSRLGALPIVALLALAPLAGGCGHPEEEWQGKLREIDKLHADLGKLQAQHDDDDKKLADDQKTIDDLKVQLKDLGISLNSTKEETESLKIAVAEYKERAAQLTAMENRFKELRTRLQKLTDVGLHVVVRNNRMVIQLPGDVLFDPGSDTIKAEGKKALLQVADVIGQDEKLNKRDFQVAGHTDNVDYSGPLHDNWGLSLMRARQVILFMTAPKTPAKGKTGETGGGLDPKHWAAAGYGLTDPLVGTVEKQTKEEKQKNRRVELVMQPNVEEMVSLKDFEK